MSDNPDLVIGEDGLARPTWGAAEPLMPYYDTEWGMPMRDERGMFERLSLEAFQSGLSWVTILRKRPAFRAAFADFDPDAVAAYDDGDVERLMADAGIVRNRAKVNATIANARATVALRDEGGLPDFLWSFQPAETPAAGPVRRHPDQLAGVGGPVEGPAEEGLPVRRTDHDVRPDGGRRHRRHPPAGQSPAGQLGCLAALTYSAPTDDRAAADARSTAARRDSGDQYCCWPGADRSPGWGRCNRRAAGRSPVRGSVPNGRVACG